MSKNDSINDSRTTTIKTPNNFRFSFQQEFIKWYESDLGKKSIFVVDLSGTTYLDSAALGMMLVLRKQLEGSSAKIILKRPKQDVLNTLKLAMFHELFTIEN